MSGKFVIKYKKRALPLLVLIVAILLLDKHFFYLFKYPHVIAQYFSGNYFHIILGIVGLFFFLLISRTSFVKENQGIRFCWNYSLWIYLAWFTLTLYSIVIYPNQTVMQTISEGAFLLVIPFAIIILYYIEKYNTFNELLNILNVMYFVWCILIVLQQISYASKGTLIFDFKTLIGEDIRLREYGLRLSLTSMGNIMLLYNFSKLIGDKTSKKNRLVSSVLTILGIYCVIFVQQTRMFMIADFLAMIVIYFASLGKKPSLKNIVGIFVFFIGLFFFLDSGIVQQLLNSFTNSNSEQFASTTIRISAISYYLKCFANSPIWGNGFARSEYYYYIEHGFTDGGYYYYSDTGIIGVIANMGLIGLFIYLVPLVRNVKTSIKIMRHKRTIEGNFFLGLVVWLIITSISLIVFAKSSIITFAIVIAIGEHLRNCVMKDNT